ncbi:hypothetical protein A4X13_0g3811 [Tilletia indica]|uniref:Uncharacterized protein n=1 Tax=Tilletia indica TaxID=43049 RepID=A0A177TF18_9BASI|nr:hypothetical protein A4X13_0g3811 [Tilletia indica]
MRTVNVDIQHLAGYLVGTQHFVPPEYAHHLQHLQNRLMMAMAEPSPATSDVGPTHNDDAHSKIRNDLASAALYPAPTPLPVRSLNIISTPVDNFDLSEPYVYPIPSVLQRGPALSNNDDTYREPLTRTSQFLTTRAPQTTTAVDNHRHLPAFFLAPTARQAAQTASMAALMSLSSDGTIDFTALSLWEQACPEPQAPRPLRTRIRTKPVPALTHLKPALPRYAPDTPDFSAAVHLMKEQLDGVPLREFAKFVDAGCLRSSDPGLQRSFQHLKELYCDRGRAAQMLNAMSVAVHFEICDVWRPGYKCVHTGVRLPFPLFPYNEYPAPEMKYNAKAEDME